MNIEQPPVPQLNDSADKIKVLYTGYFIKDIAGIISKFPPKHAAKVLAHHSTIAFKPQNIDDIDVGAEFGLRIIGRVSDEKGDALLVESPKSKNKHPHITVSCAQGVSPVYSNEMIEKAFENGTVEHFAEPVVVEAIEGYFDGKKDVLSK